MSAPFEREERYIVIKRKYLDSTEESLLRLQLAVMFKAPIHAVVVEADWPEYEPVWKMIEERVTGGPTRVSPWRPIETAPKDGTEIQLWGDGEWTPRAYWCAKKDGWYYEYWDADWRSNAESSVYAPSHWQPLPEAPKDG